MAPEQGRMRQLKDRRIGDQGHMRRGKQAQARGNLGKFFYEGRSRPPLGDHCCRRSP